MGNAPANNLEREIKFEVDSSFDLPDLTPIVRQAVRRPDEKTRTVYLDTPDLRLWSRGITLRHRRAPRSAKGTWTVKLPSSGDGPTLDRTELSWPGNRTSVPADVTSLLAGLVRRSELRELVELSALRSRVDLVQEEGPIGHLDSDIVTVSGGPRDGERFRQVELELESEFELGEAKNPRVVADICKQMVGAGARVDRRPKLATALGLVDGRGGKPGDPAAVPDLSKDATMGTVVRAAIAGGLDRLLDHDYRLRLAGADADPEDVHQARVATRRLRSDLKTLSGLIDPIWVEHTRSELRWIGTVLGQVRDADVLDQTVADDGYAGNADSSSSAGRDELHRRLRSERQDAARRLAEAMVTPRYFDLLDRLHAAAGRPPLLSSGNGLPPRLRAATPGGPARQGLPLLLKKRRRAVAKSVRRAGPHPSDQDLHQIRIHSKNLRYAAELAEPVLGKPAARTAENAKRVQTVLGEHHDASTAAEWLRRAALDGPPVMSFEAGRLAARQEAAKDRAYRRWRKARRALQS